MKTPYLIQRLRKPFKKLDNGEKSMMESITNAFSFGGGLVNGGISKEAMKLLNGIWRYDYMGSAEFEFGAVPKSLQEIAQNIKNYVIGEIEVVGKCYDYSIHKNIEGKAAVFYVCKKEDESEVREWIHKLADDKKRNYHTKEAVMLAGSICRRECYLDNVGWHDINNHYLFFTDKTMHDAFCKAFGLVNQETKTAK